jgi:phosphoribosylglycinamide formyltransferase-1
LPIGVLISGQGTNLNAILSRCEDGTLDADVRVVISNRADAPGLAHGSPRGIPTFVHARSEYPSRDTQQRAITDHLLAYGVEIVVLAGYDQILGPPFLRAFDGRIVNLHPSLLPSFGGGMRAVRDALEYGAKVTGCTVHFVATDPSAVDAGPIILQEPVRVLEDDTEETLLTRIHAAEHELLSEAIQLLAEDRLRVEGRRVRILPARERRSA